MRTAEQILATRFEKIVRAGMLADPDTQGAVRRATVDAAKAVVLYVGAGEVSEGLRIAAEVAVAAQGSDREATVTRAYEVLARAAGKPTDPKAVTGVQAA